MGFFWVIDQDRVVGAINGRHLLHSSIIRIMKTPYKTSFYDGRLCRQMLHRNREITMDTEPQKNAFEKKSGKGMVFDLDYGKQFIIGLCVYIAVPVS